MSTKIMVKGKTENSEKKSEKKDDAKPTKKASAKKSQKTSASVPVIYRQKATKESPSSKSMPMLPVRIPSSIPPTSKVTKLSSNTQTNTRSGSQATSTSKPAGKTSNTKTDSSVSTIKKDPSIKPAKSQIKPSVKETTKKEVKPSAKPTVVTSHEPNKTKKTTKLVLKTKKHVGSSHAKMNIESTMKVIEKQLSKPKKGVSLKQQKGSGEAPAIKKALAVQKKVRKLKIVPKCKT